MANDVALDARIQQVAQQWQAMSRGTDAEKAVGRHYYQTNVFPLVRELFAQREAAKVTRAYELAVMTVGGSPEALILSLSALRPEKVFFLHTAWQRSLQGVDQIVDVLGLKPSQFDRAEVNPDDTLDTYRKVKQAIEWAGVPKNIVVDISGGKKTMSVAAGLAAYVIGADIAYVDSEEFLQGYGKPRPGTEFLAFLSNPYTVFGDLARREAEGLFSRHHYGSAWRIFDRLAEDVPSVVDYMLFRHLSAAYRAWDRFDLPTAAKEMENLTDQLHRRRTLEPELALMPFAGRLARQSAALNRLRPLTQQLARSNTLDMEVLSDPRQPIDLIFSLYTNALRRETEQRLDMAALLLYRVLEMLAQRRLAHKGIDTSQPDYGILNTKLDDAIWREAVKRCLKRNPRSGLPGKLALQDAYILLDILRDPLIDTLNWGSMNSAVLARNRSIFAHGFRLLNEKSYQKFRKVVDDRLEVFSKAEGLDLAEMLEIYRFVQPFIENHEASNP